MPKIASQFCPPQILRLQGPNNFYPNLHPCLAAHYAGKFGEVIPTSPKVIRPNTLSCVPIFEFLLPQFFEGTPKFFDYLIKLHICPVIWRRFTAIEGGGSEISPLNQLPPKLFSRARPTLAKCTHFQSCVKVSRRSSEQLGDIAPHSARKNRGKT